MQRNPDSKNKTKQTNESQNPKMCNILQKKTSGQEPSSVRKLPPLGYDKSRTCTVDVLVDVGGKESLIRNRLITDAKELS